MPKTNLTIQGMHCESCKMLIEDVCKDISGVIHCSVNFESGHALLEHDGSVNVAHLKKEIETLGKYAVEETL